MWIIGYNNHSYVPNYCSFYPLVAADDYYVYPSPLLVVLYTPGNGDRFEVQAVYYDDIHYSTVNDLLQAYNDGNVRDFTPNDFKLYSDRYE